MVFAVLLGYVTTRKSGTPFAMITLGMGELVFAMSLMFPEFFGGEAGVTGNRVVGEPVLGISFGPQIQVYYLIAVYTFVCTARDVRVHADAARPHAQRGARQPRARRLRRLQHAARALHSHSSSPASSPASPAAWRRSTSRSSPPRWSAPARSGAYLLFTFLGGATFFFGPIIGAVLMVLALVLLSEFTKAWLLYLGLVFLFMVMYAPGGIASLIMMNLRVAAFGRLRRLLPPYAALLAALSGAAGRRGGDDRDDLPPAARRGAGRAAALPRRRRSTAPQSAHWFGAAVVLLVGFGAVRAARGATSRARWSEAQTEIERDSCSRRQRA